MRKHKKVKKTKSKIKIKFFLLILVVFGGYLIANAKTEVIVIVNTTKTSPDIAQDDTGAIFEAKGYIDVVEEKNDAKNANLSVENIKKMIIDEFGAKNGQIAIKIAECESQFDPSRVGDKNIMVVNDETGELVGDSIGLFQVRTGAKNWNRAARNGMSADDFRDWMHDPKANIKYAHDIFERRGWEGWHNCAMKVGAYN